MVEFFTETLYKKVWIFGYKASLSASLHEKASPGCVYFLDDIWEKISMPHFKDLLPNSMASDGKKHIEKIICAPEVIDVTCKHSNSSSEEIDRSNISSILEEKEKARI